MKRTLLAVTVLVAVFALVPACHAAENPAPAAIPGADAAAAVQTALPAPTGHCAPALSQEKPDLQSQLDAILTPATRQATPCSKCFLLGVDCCSTPTGGTRCC